MMLLTAYLTGYFLSFGILMQQGVRVDGNKISTYIFSLIGATLSWIMVGSAIADLLDNNKNDNKKC